MQSHGIKLDFQVGEIEVIHEISETISTGKSEDYVTRIELTLPKAFGKIKDGTYYVEYNNDQVKVIASTLTDREHDLFFKHRYTFDIGPPNSGLPNIPWEAITDHRGKYPTLLISILFPRRIATWIDKSNITGLKKTDMEEYQITGQPDNQEKILALRIINRLIQYLKIEDLPSIKYDDVTMFIEFYFKKVNSEFILGKINALTTKEAYKNAVYDYFLVDHRRAGVDQSFHDFYDRFSAAEIRVENDLKRVVEFVIENVIKHHVESRRWIEPFWEGSRTRTYKNKKINIPAVPKKEPQIQPTLHVIFDVALSPLGVHVIRESNEGVGAMDFRFDFTTKTHSPISVGAEFKLAHHKEIEKGITIQLPAYLKAIRSKSGIFVVMWFKDGKFFTQPKKHNKSRMEQWLEELASCMSRDKGIDISSSIVDASIRVSASQL